ncbi:MAG: AI-2E family transporter [Isosphaeraceae bacterium]
METEPLMVVDEPGPEPGTASANGSLLLRVTYGLVAVAASLYLLNTLGDVLRPVFIAVLFCYAIMPLRIWLHRYFRPGIALLIIGLGLIVGSYVLGRMVYVNVSAVWKDMPTYQVRAERLVERVTHLIDQYLPASSRPDSTEPIRISLKRAQQYLGQFLTLFANFAAEAMIVGLYMVFLLEEAARFPRQVRAAFPPGRAARILDVSRSINDGVVDYLSVKVKVNLLVAVPATLLMLAFGLEGAVLWGVLTFFGRFVPYLGSVATCAVPVALAALQFESPAKAIAFSLLLIAIHVLIEYVIEPVMTGKAVGLSPLAVMLALSFWGLTWGIVGMCLAVPLMVILKIALEHIPATRPVARMISHGER